MTKLLVPRNIWIGRIIRSTPDSHMESPDVIINENPIGTPKKIKNRRIPRTTQLIDVLSTVFEG